MGADIEQASSITQPGRWDKPFDPDMRDADIAILLARDDLGTIDASKFPRSTPLEGILRYDSRIREYKAGDLIIREGDYGNSAFWVLSGGMRVVISPGLPNSILGRGNVKRKGIFSALSQIWRNSSIVEERNYGEDSQSSYLMEGETTNLYRSRQRSRIFKDFNEGDITALTRIFSDTWHSEIPTLRDQYQSILLQEGELIGEIAALGRFPRTASVYAEVDTRVLEIRWQGLRDIRKFDPVWRDLIDNKYRERLLDSMLASSPYFSGVDESTRQLLTNQILFETYGDFEWSSSYKSDEGGGIGSASEPIVASENDYADGALLIGAGFARVSVEYGHGHRTINYLRAGDIYGYQELYAGWKESRPPLLKSTLSALGYLHILRIPHHILVKYVFPNQQGNDALRFEIGNRTFEEDSLMEWAVEERFINGSQVMLIDQDRCVKCDDCVRACSDTHNGNPRFIRHGKTWDHWMVTHACMHCTDPVCMIGCPTGAIHRTLEGAVVINDISCIGCATCANSCPYDNIRMVEVRDRSGQLIVDANTGLQIMKATKCDLCSTQRGGPSCVRACPHDALKRMDFHSTVNADFQGDG